MISCLFLMEKFDIRHLLPGVKTGRFAWPWQNVPLVTGEWKKFSGDWVMESMTSGTKS